MTILALYLSVILSAASLALGFFPLTSFIVWILILGALWLLAIQQNWDWVSSVMLPLAVIAAGFGLYLKLSPGWMFAGGLFALFAWDLNDFHVRLRVVVKDQETRNMERRHLIRVTLMAFIGLVLASVSMLLIRAKFSMEWAALLVLIVLLGLAQMAGWFRK